MPTPEIIAILNAHDQKRIEIERNIARTNAMRDAGLPDTWPHVIHNAALFDYLKSLEARITALEAKENLL